MITEKLSQKPLACARDETPVHIETQAKACYSIYLLVNV
jgi:hypothetical protein